jgi:hypothetical protein
MAGPKVWLQGLDKLLYIIYQQLAWLDVGLEANSEWRG